MALAATVLVDTGFLTALLRRRDVHRAWAVAQAAEFQGPWHCCEAVLTEVLFLLGTPGLRGISTLLDHRSLRVSFSFADHQEAVLSLMRKYADAPMTLADACLVRMTEVLPQPVVLTTDAHFRVYRRHGRQVVPCVLPR
jgi:predicted nucleic acid-binding protein